MIYYYCIPEGRRDRHIMNYEKSCGAIVYRKHHGNTEILLVRHIKSGYWSFPKGHVEEGETEEETARREIKEETGLDVLLDTGFRETVTFPQGAIPKKPWFTLWAWRQAMSWCPSRRRSPS